MRKYNYVEEIINTAKKLRNVFDFMIDSDEYLSFFNPDLCGLCAIASITLKDIYKRDLLHHADVYKGEFLEDEHCWVCIQGMFVDITATQFGLNSPVICVRADSDFAKNHFNKGQIINNINVFDEWPEEQRPDENIINTIKEKYYEFNRQIAKA